MNTKRDEILKAAAHGNAAALDFLRAFATRAHWVDDLLDEYGGERKAECSRLAQMEGEWLLTISGNPFFLANRAALVPAMLLALNAWVDSEAWTEPMCLDKARALFQDPEVRHRAQISVIKGQWHEVVWLVAWLTGGWQHLRATSAEFREYDFEPEGRTELQNSQPCGRKDPNGTVRI